MSSLIKSVTVSWKTTVAALGTILALWGPTIEKLFDNDAATMPNWNIVIAGTIAAIGLIFARDVDKSSENHSTK